MACTHPFGVDLIRNAEGEIIGVICPSCGRAARKGDPVWPLNVAMAMYAAAGLILPVFFIGEWLGLW